MLAVSGLIEALLAPKGMVYWLVTVAVGAVAAAVFLMNVAHRDTLGDALTAPERLWSYDAGILDKFIADARVIDTRFGDNALAHYVRPTLLWNDLAFAVALAVFIALAALGVAPLLPWQPWVARVMLFMALMGVLYGIADVAEDWKLATILDKGPSVDPVDAATANLLTRIKIATNILSGIGVVMFLLLQVAAILFRRLHA
jgi:hypothetical protein